MPPLPELTQPEAQGILDAHLPAPPVPIDALSELTHARTATSRAYLIHTVTPSSFLITIPTRTDSQSSTYLPNALSAQHALLTHLHTHLPLPHPFPIPAPVAATPAYLLLRLPRAFPPTVSLVPAAPTPRLDAHLGAALRAVHNCVNDWFGLHAWEPEGVYRWEEAFARLLEDALASAPSIPRLALDAPAVHTYLARAIGSFLFDDVEEPAFVTLAPGASSVFVVEGGAPEEPALWLAALPHALYGDPLLDRVFSEVPFPLVPPAPAPSAEVLAGYGKPLILFARQRTKRLWYDLYLGLVLLLNAQAGHVSAEEEAWARELVRRSVELLKDAPCY